MADLFEAALLNEATILSSPETEFMRQQRVIDQIASILVERTFSDKDRSEAIAQLRSETDYGNLGWRSLHMAAIGMKQTVVNNT